MLVRLHTQDLKLVQQQHDPTLIQRGVPNEDLAMKDQEDPFMIPRGLVMMDREDQVTMCLGYELGMMLTLDVLQDILHLETLLHMGLRHHLIVEVGTKHQLEVEETPVGDEPKVPLR